MEVVALWIHVLSTSLEALNCEKPAKRGATRWTVKRLSGKMEH